MANTANIDLVKPAGTDHALISVINSNSDKIDAEAGRQRGNFAGTYSSTSGYAVGDYCIYQGNLYRCTTAIGSSGENWTAGHWTSVKVGTELKGLSDQIGNIGKSPSSFVGTSTNCSIGSGSKQGKVGALQSIELAMTPSSNITAGTKVVSGMAVASGNSVVLNGWDNNSSAVKRFKIDTAGDMYTLDALDSGHSIRIYAVYPSA